MLPKRKSAKSIKDYICIIYDKGSLAEVVKRNESQYI